MGVATEKWVQKKTGQLSKAETEEPDEVEEKNENPLEGRDGIEKLSQKPDKRSQEVKDAEKKAKAEEAKKQAEKAK